MATRKLVCCLFFFGIFLTSCHKESELLIKGNNYYVKTGKLEIHDEKEIPWKVGFTGSQTISKGIRFSFDLPFITEENWEKLYKEKEIDGWLVKLTKSSTGRKEILGLYGVKIVYPGVSNIKTRVVKMGSLGVNYAAANISMRLSRLNCPALNHNKRIGKLNTDPKTDDSRVLSIGAAEEDRIEAKVEAMAFSPVSANGGMELEGKYQVSIAFFNSVSKMKKSNYLEIDQNLVIGKDETVLLKGCSGSDIPEKSKDDEPMNQFKFGR